MTFEVQVSIPYTTGLPRDVATNVWHFDALTVPATPTTLAALVVALRTFYSNVYGPPDHLAGYAVPGNTRVKIFDLTSAPPRVPVVDVIAPITATPSEFSMITPETAVVCSISGSGIAPPSLARQRGRLYLGCLGPATAVSPSAGGFPVVAESFRSTVAAAAEAMIGLSIDAGFTWVVYSRVALATSPVVKGFVDDAFDTQRRRGQDPTIRTSWAA